MVENGLAYVVPATMGPRPGVPVRRTGSVVVKPAQGEWVGMPSRVLVHRVDELGAHSASTDGLVPDLRVLSLRCVFLRAGPSRDSPVGLLSPQVSTRTAVAAVLSDNR